ncbi:MAG: hypothetical protein AAF550_07195 [Myxococcota bacterium]
MALVQWIPQFKNRSQGWGVRALGILRLPTERALLRLFEPPENDSSKESNTTAESELRDGTVVVAEGGTCAGNESGASCERYARLLMAQNGRLVRRGIYNQAGECLQSDIVYIDKVETIHVGGNRARSFVLNASLSYADGTMQVEEHITIEDGRISQPDMPSRPFRVIEATRGIEIDPYGFIAGRESLWRQALELFGSTRMRTKRSRASRRRPRHR